MRNLKKVLALVVAVAMIASMGLVASAANYSDVATNAKYADAVNLLSNLGIITGYEDGTFKPENTVTRAEAATMIVRMLGLADEVEAGETNFTDVAADNWASGYVNVAEANGVVNGMGDGTFNPNGEVTYGQIVKMIVCALGYGPVAEANGGYLGGGYLYAGSSQVTGFTKGVAGTANAAASRATVAQLIYNALEVELMDQTKFSTGINGSTYEVLEGKTILTEYLELEKVDGVVVETYLSNAAYTEGDNTISLVVTKNYDKDDQDYPADEEAYVLVADGTDAATLLGYTVTAYVGANEDEDDAVFAIAKKAGKNNVLTLDTALIKEFGETGIVYYKSESAKSTTEAEIQAYVGKNAEVGVAVENNVIVNGFNANYAADLFAVWEDLDEITFIDNDNDGDFEFISAILPQDAVEFVVAEIDNEDDIWTFTNEDEDEDFEVNYEDEDALFTVVKDGKIVDASAVAEGDVITVLDKNVPVVTVYVSSVAVTGTVDEVDGEVYTIAGKEYELSPVSFDLEEDALEAGEEGIFYINAVGKIAAVETESTIANADYVYVVDADASEGDFGATEYLVKYVDAQGEVKIVTIKSKKVKVVDDEESEDVELTDDDAYEAIDAKIGELGVLARVKLASGELSAIYFEGAEDFEAINTYENDAETENKTYNEKRGTYGVVDLAAETLVFEISDEEDEDLEDRITVSTVGKSFADEASYSFIAYGPADEVAQVLVVTAGNTSVDAEGAVMVVTKVSTIDVEDEETVKITGIMAGEKVSVVVDPDESVTVAKGNVILFVEAGEFVEDVQVLFDSTDEELGEVIPGGDIVDEKSDEDVSIHFGEITEKKTKYLVLGEDEEDGKFYFADEVNVTVVDYAGANVSITAGSMSDVKASSTKWNKYAFVKTALDAEDEITDIVVFVEAAE